MAESNVLGPYAHLSDEEAANRVRMLTRSDMDHEAVCVMARDRIRKLSQELHDAELQCDMQADINRRSAKALGKPLNGENSSWDDIPEQIEKLVWQLDQERRCRIPREQEFRKDCERLLAALKEASRALTKLDPLGENHDAVLMDDALAQASRQYEART